MHRVHDDFAYKPARRSSARVVDLLVKRHGVCQDFSHVMVAGLRSLGLAGRYVSGYLATRPPPGRPRLVGADASHAWVGSGCPGAGWLHLDPTNNRLTDASHATVAWGRDYGDVPPVQGRHLHRGQELLDEGVGRHGARSPERPASFELDLRVARRVAADVTRSS